MTKSDVWAAGLALGILTTRATYAADSVVAIHSVSFSVCHQQGCAEQTAMRLTPTEAKSILQGFVIPPATPAQERSSIALAISRFEQIIGPRTGTDRDLGGTFPGAFRARQMDCIDESTNTTTYLQLLDNAGLLHWHTILKPVTRLPIPRGWWPHTSAAIREDTTGTKYAVDSWFDANGSVPHIVELTLWRRGWKPTRTIEPSHEPQK